MVIGKKRRLIVIFGVLCVIVALGVGAHYAIRLASIGVAQKAKWLCSGVFVSGLDPQQVLADLEIDDLEILKHVNTSLDRESRSVTATALGFVKRHAIYRQGSGCALVYDGGKTRDEWPVADEGRQSSIDVRPLADRVLLEESAAAEDGNRGRLKSVLDRAFAEPKLLRPRRTRAVVIVHKGRLVAERYAEGILADTPMLGWSMTKSVMNALAGILVREGRLSTGAQVPIANWRSPDDPRGRITLDHLLRMSSGLRFNESITNPLEDVTYMLYGAPDMASYAAEKELEVEPGMRWQYSSGTSNIIARVVRNVMADDVEYLNFARRALFDRIGMTGATIEADASGTFVGSSFMYATARDWARFGLLYLQDGVWQGQRILPADWVAYTRTPAPADASGHYGAHFWLEVPDAYRGANGGLPPDAYHAVGHEGQFVTIVPSREAVIVRLGLTRYPAAWDHTAFVREVLEALVR